MRIQALHWLSCPNCFGDLFLKEQIQKEQEHIMSGILSCKKCSADFSILHGLPILLPSLVDSLPEIKLGPAYDKYFRTVVKDDADEGAKIYGKNRDEEFEDFKEKVKCSKLELLRGKICLDAGCGLARVSELLSTHCEAVIALDITDHIFRNFQRLKNNPNIHLVKADIRHLPIRSASIDLVWCDGALPYVSDFGLALKNLIRVKSSNGYLYSWVYDSRMTWANRTARILHLTRLPIKARFLLLRLLFIPLALLRKVIRGGDFNSSWSGLVNGVIDLSLSKKINRYSVDSLRDVFHKLTPEISEKISTKCGRIDFEIGIPLDLQRSAIP